MKLIVALSILGAVLLLANFRWLARPVLYDQVLQHHSNHSRAMTRLAEAVAAQDEFLILSLSGGRVHGSRIKDAFPQPVRGEVHDRFYALFRDARLGYLARKEDGTAEAILNSTGWWREITDVTGILRFREAENPYPDCSRDVWIQPEGICSTQLDSDWTLEVIWFPLNLDIEQKDDA